MACAFTTPAAYTWIADNFKEERQGFANSVYSSAVYLGGGLASLSLLLDVNYGWRFSYVAVGVFGLACSGLAALSLDGDGDRPSLVAAASESSKNEGSNDDAGDGKDDAGDGKDDAGDGKDDAGDGKSPAPLQLLLDPTAGRIFLASFFRFCAGLSIGVWGATFFKDEFPSFAGQYAVGEGGKKASERRI